MTLGEISVDADSEPDYVVCGSCRQDFPLANLVDFMQHKKFDCDDAAVLDGKKGLLCKSCPEKFSTPWKLLKHAQNEHSLDIYMETDKHMNTLEEVSNNAIHSNSQDITEQYEKSFSQSLAGENLIIEESITESIPAVESEVLVGESDEFSEKIAASCGCNDQSCGITVMPGTHAELEKCCSAVVPKKRKRHIATKHLSNMGESMRYFTKNNRLFATARARSRVAPSSTYPANIYIDLASNHDDVSYTVSGNHSEWGTVSEGAKRSINGKMQHEETASNLNKTLPKGSQSVIIQPGSTFSIPLIYRKSEGYSVQKSFRNSRGGRAISSSAIKTVGSRKLKEDPEMSCYEASNTDGDENQVENDEVNVALMRKNNKRRRYPTSKPFKCDKCEDSFNQRIHLKKHQSKHTGVKPFKCEQCDYSTVERSHLKVHIRVHTGEKPFKCTYCEYATAQNSTLKIHLKRHHAEENFTCNVFSNDFTSVSQNSEHSNSAM